MGIEAAEVEMALYLVSYCWYEEYQPTIVEGPEQGDWKAYCLSLLPEAAEGALEWAKRGRRPDGTGALPLVGWDEITEALILLLKSKGYRVVELPEFKTWGGCLDKHDDNQYTPLPEELFERIKAWNERG